jgi:glycine cleavage system H protein
MSQTRYTKDHEYVHIDGDIGIVGISDHAQTQLGDVVFVELPKPGAKLVKGAAAAVVESVKAASDVYTPVSGEVVEVNDAVESEPGLINEDSQGRGWLMKIRLADAGEADGLMDEAAYQAFLATIA